MKWIMKPGYWMLFLSCWACDRIEEGNFQYTIAVEGWIEEGDVPYVMLTQTVPFFSVVDSMAIEDVVIRWAKVSVSDGEKTEILRGHIDKNYFPPFVYRGVYMIGEAGKTYTLKIEYSGKVWEAGTTIPQAVPLEEITTEVLPNDTLQVLKATFYDPPEEKNYYRFYTKVRNKNTRYIGSLMGNFDDNLFDGKKMKASVFQGLDITQKTKLEPYFHVNDTVLVKFTTMPEFGFRYWTAYENEIINSRNPFFPVSKDLPSNIPDGKGIWCGYGRKIYTILPVKK